MLFKKNINLGKIRLNLFILISFLIISFDLNASGNLDGSFTDIKVLDKISSKNILLKLKNGEDRKYKDLLIRSIKCKNSEFDDNPEITAYLQVIDLNRKDNDKVFVFNDWTFASSPSLKPFDHPVYDIWLTKCITK